MLRLNSHAARVGPRIRGRAAALLLALLLTLLAVVPGAASATEHGLGALPSRLDISPAASSARLAPLSTLPASVDLTPWTVPVGNQGSVNSCTGWAVSHALMGWYANKLGHGATSFAPMYLYSQAQVGNDGGAYVTDMFDLAVTQGNDVTANYSQGSYNWWQTPSDQQRENAARRPLLTGYDVLFSGVGGYGSAGRQAIQSALADGRPIVLAFTVRPTFYSLSPGNSLYSDTTSTPTSGNHAVVAVGYDSQGVTVQNSWGTGWGAGGFAKLAWSVVEADVYEAVAARTAPELGLVATGTTSSRTVEVRSAALRDATYEPHLAAASTFTSDYGPTGTSNRPFLKVTIARGERGASTAERAAGEIPGKILSKSATRGNAKPPRFAGVSGMAQRGLEPRTNGL